MTKEEFNKIKIAIFDMCIEMMTEKDLSVFDGGHNTAYLYEIREGFKVERIWFAYKTQINTNTLNAHGFTADATVKHLITLNKKTKCADFINLK